MRNTFTAIQIVLKRPQYFFAFIFVAIIFFVLFIAIPVYTIPGNSFDFQLSIFRRQDYGLMIFLALLVGLNVVLQIYGWRQNKKQTSQNLAQGTAAGAVGVFGAIVGTAACASCLASLFGLIGLGTGSVFFVLKNQPYFLIGAIVLMLVSLYIAAQKINKVCTSCSKV